MDESTQDPEAPLRARREETVEDQEEELEEKKGRVKKIVLILVILMLILLGLLYLSGLRKPLEAPPEPVAPISFSGPWSPIATLSGDRNGASITRKFTITSTQWRVIWSSRPKTTDDELDNSLVFFLIPQKLKDPPHDNILVVGTSIEPRTATWNFRTKPGTYYFRVAARNVKWKLKVEQMPTPGQKRN